jgi:hypothetical protein
VLAAASSPRWPPSRGAPPDCSWARPVGDNSSSVAVGRELCLIAPVVAATFCRQPRLPPSRRWPRLPPLRRCPRVCSLLLAAGRIPSSQPLRPGVVVVTSFLRVSSCKTSTLYLRYSWRAVMCMFILWYVFFVGLCHLRLFLMGAYPVQTPPLVQTLQTPTTTIRCPSND